MKNTWLSPRNSTKSAECSADGRKDWKQKLPRSDPREKACVSEKHAIASIVLVVGIDFVDVHLEVAIVIAPHIEPAGS